MLENEEYLAALWCAISESSDAAPDWFIRVLRWHLRRLPTPVQDDFFSLVAIELLQEFGDSQRRMLFREDVYRALNRVRQRLLTEIGLTSRSTHRKRESLVSEPASTGPTSDLEAQANELKELLQEHLTTEQMVVLDKMIEGRTESAIAEELGKSTRTIQRMRTKIAKVLSRII